MAEKRWPTRAVMRYVARNLHPTESNADAYRWIDSNVESGAFMVWCRVRGKSALIDKSEWWRNPKKEGADAFGALEALQWKGLAQLTDEDRATLEFEFDPLEVRRLCASPRGRGGRPPGEWDLFYFEVIVRALDKDGLPNRKADLTSAMADWCAANMREAPEPATIEKKVRDLYRFLEAKGIKPSGERIR